MNRAAPLLYNPREESPDVLEAMLVGRDDLLKELEDDLRAQINSATRQHWLIRGPRGMGKTHLIAVLYYRIRRTPGLGSHLLPVWLGEAAAYDAYSAGMLLLAIARRLVEELAEERDPGASALRTALEEIRHTGDDPALFNDLCQLLKDEANRRGKILVVMMENLDAWLASMSGKRGTSEAGRLRSLLSEDKEFLFISTTPTQYLDRLSRPNSPLFGHLRERRLRPLSEDDVRELFGRLKRLTGSGIVIEDDAQRPETRLRWRILQRLAGGSPRASVMAFAVMSGAPGIRAMVEEFARLLDAQTPYYEARLARLSPRECAIVNALAMASTNLTISEIAAQSRLPERSLSTQVKRLLDEGHIGPATGQQGKGSVFELTDGLFRIWHHYRSGRRLLEPLVRFLAFFHTPHELESALQSLSADLDSPRSALERGLVEATANQIQSALDYARSPAVSVERERLWTECANEIATADSQVVDKYRREFQDRGRISDPERAQRDAMSVIATCRSAQGPAASASMVAAVVSAAALLAEMGRLQQSEDALREIIARFGDATEPALRGPVARAMVSLGVTLFDAGRVEEALATFRDVIARFGDATELALREQVGRAMFNLGVTLGQAGRAGEGIATYREVIARFGDAAEPALRERVASAIGNLGVALGQAGWVEEALTMFRDTIARFGDAAEPALQELIARTMVNLGITLGQAGRVEEAITTYRDLIARFGDATEPALRGTVALATVSLGVALGRAGRVEDALAMLRDIIARFSDAAEPVIQEAVARAMVNLGVALGQAGRVEEAIATYREVIARFGDAAQPVLREAVARAMASLGAVLGQIGRLEEGMTTARDVIARFGDVPEPMFQEQVGLTMYNLGVTLGQAGRVEEAIARYREVIARFGTATEPALREQVALAMFNLGVTLGRAGRAEEKLATYREVIARFGDAPEPALREQVARAMFSLGVTLGQAGQVEEEVAAYREVIARFGDATEPALREQVAGAMVNLGAALGQAGRVEEAIATLQDLIVRFSGSPEPRLRATAAIGGLNLAAMLSTAGRHEEALQAATRAMDAHVALPGSQDAAPVTLARLLISGALHALGRSTEGALVLVDAARQLADGVDVPLSLAEEVLKALLVRLPLGQAAELLHEIQGRSKPEISETARLYDFVLAVVRAEEPATHKAKSGPASRKKSALGRVPPELRETVREKAEAVRRERASHPSPPHSASK